MQSINDQLIKFAKLLVIIVQNSIQSKFSQNTEMPIDLNIYYWQLFYVFAYTLDYSFIYTLQITCI